MCPLRSSFGPLLPPFAPLRRQVPWQSRPFLLLKRSALNVNTSYRTRVNFPYRLVLYDSNCIRRKILGFGKKLRSHLTHFPIYWPFLSRTFVYLRHLFSLSQFDFRVLPLFSIVNSLMVGTTVISINFRFFPPHLQFPVFVHEIQSATDGSPFVVCLLPNNSLKKNLLHIFPNIYAWTDLHNCLHV